MRCIVLSLLSVLALAPAARASTLSLDSFPYEYTYTASAGKANALTVTESGSSLIFTDPAETIDASSSGGCVLSNTNHTATCAGGASTPITVLLGDQNDSLTANVPDSPLTADGGAGNDTITGGPEDDSISGGTGSDHLSGGAGFDVLDYRASPQGVAITLGSSTTTSGAPGENDVVSGDFEGAYGSNHNDTITGGPEDDAVDPEGGADNVSTGGGNDLILAQDDTATGTDTGSDTIDAGPGDDTIDSGGAVGDVVNGGDGNDEINGDGSADTVSGGAGDDKITPGLGNDVVDGGDGNDTFIDEPTVPVGRQDDDVVSGGAGNDVLTGAAGNDSIDGGAGNDAVAGGEGNDVLTGGAGIDSIAGGPGDDTIHASDGERDSVTCGGGSDVVDGDAFDFVGADCATVTGGAVPAGGPGPQGPPGASAPAPAFVVVAVDRSLRVKAGRKVVLRYVTTLAGQGTLTVKKGTKVVATIPLSAKPGFDRATWNGRAGRRKAAKGAYTLSLSLVAADGRRKTTSLKLRLT